MIPECLANCPARTGWVRAQFRFQPAPVGRSARLAYEARLNAGQIQVNRNAPAGALVFFRGSHPAVGHAGIAVGDGANYWTTDGTIHIAPYSQGLATSAGPTLPPRSKRCQSVLCA